MRCRMLLRVRGGDLVQPSPGRSLAPFFITACAEARRAAGASYARVADVVGVDTNSIRRFEGGKIWPSHTLEAYAAGYAEIINMRDGRELIQRALDLWLEHGKRPMTSHEREQKRELPPPSRESYVTDVMRSIRRAEAREQASRQPTAIRKKKAAGE
jgi:transcriptional regulator with XRE-family HTH domain